MSNEKLTGKDQAYVEAEKARYEAEQRESKQHEMPLVMVIENPDGTETLAYREKL